LEDIKAKLVTDEITFKRAISPEAKDILLKLLKKNPKDRISLEEIFKHPFILKHLDEFENNKEAFKHIPPEPEWDNDVEVKVPNENSESKQKAAFEEALLNDRDYQQVYIRKVMEQNKINNEDVDHVYFLRDENGVLRMRFQMKDRPLPKRGNSERKKTSSLGHHFEAHKKIIDNPDDKSPQKNPEANQISAFDEVMKSNQKTISELLEPRKLSSDFLGENSDQLFFDADKKPASNPDKKDPAETQPTEQKPDQTTAATRTLEIPPKNDQKKTLNLIQPSTQTPKDTEPPLPPSPNTPAVFVRQDSSLAKPSSEPRSLDASAEQRPPAQASPITVSNKTQLAPSAPNRGLADLSLDTSGYQQTPALREPLNLLKYDKPRTDPKTLDHTSHSEQSNADTSQPLALNRPLSTGPANVLMTTGLFPPASQLKTDSATRVDAAPSNTHKPSEAAKDLSPLQTNPHLDEDLTTDNNKKAGITLNRSRSGISQLQTGQPAPPKEPVQPQKHLTSLPRTDQLTQSRPEPTQAHLSNFARPPPPQNSSSSRHPSSGPLTFKATHSAGYEAHKSAGTKAATQDHSHRFEEQPQNKSRLHSGAGTRENSLTRAKGQGHPDAYKPLSKDLNTHRRDKENSLLHSKDNKPLTPAPQTQPPSHIQQIINTPSTAVTNLENHFRPQQQHQPQSQTTYPATGYQQTTYPSWSNQNQNQSTQQPKQPAVQQQDTPHQTTKENIKKVYIAADLSDYHRKTDAAGSKQDSDFRESPSGSSSKLKALKLKEFPPKVKVDDFSKTVFNPKIDILKNIENQSKTTPMSRSLIDDNSNKNSTANTPSKTHDYRDAGNKSPIPASFTPNTMPTTSGIRLNPSAPTTELQATSKYLSSSENLPTNSYTGQSYYLNTATNREQQTQSPLNKTFDYSRGSTEPKDQKAWSPSTGRYYPKTDLDTSLIRTAGLTYTSHSQSQAINPLQAPTAFGQSMAMKSFSPLAELLAPAPVFGGFSQATQNTGYISSYMQQASNDKREGTLGPVSSELRSSNNERSKSQKVSRYEKNQRSEEDKPKPFSRPEDSPKHPGLTLNPRSYLLPSYPSVNSNTVTGSASNLSTTQAQGHSKPATYTSTFGQTDTSSNPPQQTALNSKKSSSPKSVFANFAYRMSEPPEPSKNASRFNYELLNSTNNQQNKVTLNYLPTPTMQTTAAIGSSPSMTSNLHTNTSAPLPLSGASYSAGFSAPTNASINKENNKAVSYTQPYLQATNHVPGFYGSSFLQAASTAANKDSPALSQPLTQLSSLNPAPQPQLKSFYSSPPSTQEASQKAADKSSFNQPTFSPQTSFGVQSAAVFGQPSPGFGNQNKITISSDKSSW